MIVRDFRGLPELQEVTCSGDSLGAEVKILSLRIFRVADDVVLAYISHFTNECVTFGDYASCTVNAENTRLSELRILVPDLANGEKRKYGCIVTRLDSVDTHKETWTITVEQRRE